jgi:hypothetical protein
MHGSFITGAHCLANTVGSQDASSVAFGNKEVFLMFKWSKVLELVVHHVICHSNGQVSKVVLCDTVKLFQIVRRQIVLITN